MKDLWLQGAVHKGQLRVRKVRGDVNPADVLTKFQDRAGVQRLLALASIKVDPIVRDERVEGGCQTIGLDQAQETFLQLVSASAECESGGPLPFGSSIAPRVSVRNKQPRTAIVSW